MPMKKFQHIRVTAFRDTLENLWKVSKSEISLLPILFACEINIKFNSMFFFFDENIQIICLKLIFKEFCL